MLLHDDSTRSIESSHRLKSLVTVTNKAANFIFKYSSNNCMLLFYKARKNKNITIRRAFCICIPVEINFAKFMLYLII